jgi:hypothetical protein
MSETEVNEPRESVTAENKSNPITRRPYSPPRVLSAEPLEAAAAACDPPTGGFGKTVPLPCGTLGS